jgi:hypothetical protein
MAETQYKSFDWYKGSDNKYYYYYTSSSEWRGPFDNPASSGNEVTPPANAPFSPVAVQKAAEALQPLSTDVKDAAENAGSASSGSSLRYPLDIGATAADHFAVFDFYDYSPPFSSEAVSISGTELTTLKAYNSSAENLKAAAYPQIVLYMPEGVAASYRTNWDGKAFGNVVAAGLKASSGIMNGDYKTAIDSLKNMAKTTMAKAATDLSAAVTSAIAKRVTGDSIDTQTIFSASGGAILNPNVELIFGGHDLRTLQLTFKMVPYNKPEAEAVDAIVKTFKKVMLPKFTGGTNMSNFWKEANKSGNGFIGLPNLCKITFFKGSAKNEAITQFKTCAITDFDVNYTPDGVAAFGPDGYPVATQISLSFMETKLVYAEDVNSGY